MLAVSQLVVEVGCKVGPTKPNRIIDRHAVPNKSGHHHRNLSSPESIITAWQQRLSKTILESHDDNTLDSATLHSLPQRRQEKKIQKKLQKQKYKKKVPKKYKEKCKKKYHRLA